MLVYARLMQGKMSDSTMKYFIAISENKKKDLELKHTELKIEGEQKKMLTRYWKDKIDIFDDMIRLNVRTPTYTGRTTPGAEDEPNDNGRISLGPMQVDAKLMSNKPVSLQRGKKGSSAGLEPVICIEGSDAICYPNKEARKGRKVALNCGVLRRMEQCKAITDSIDSIQNKDYRDEETSSPYHWRAGHSSRRPFTAPRGNMRGKSSQKRNAKSASVRPAATALVGPSDEKDNKIADSNVVDRRTPTGGSRVSSATGRTSLTVATAKRLAVDSAVPTNKRILSTSSVSTDTRLLSTSSVS